MSERAQAAERAPYGPRPRIADVLLGAEMARAPVFTTGDVAYVAGVSLSAAARALTTLAERDVVTPVTRGLWARPTHPSFSLYAVVPFLLGASLVSGLDSAEPGYVSLLSALNLRGLIDQIPRTVQVVLARQRAPLRAPVGAFSFHRLQPALVTGYEPGGRLANFELARPTKALFDILYVSTRRGLRHAHLPELDRSPDVTDEEMREYIDRIRSASLRTAVTQRWERVRPRIAAR